jgi:hypothetical protein
MNSLALYSVLQGTTTKSIYKNDLGKKPIIAFYTGKMVCKL